MNILLYIVLLLAGFALLIKGADIFVAGSSSLAKKMKIPPLIVGLTIVAMGTSAPELAVSISSAVKGSNGLAVSNVIGSDIFNLLMVLGVCSAISPLSVSDNVIKRDYPVSLAAIAAMELFLINGIIGRWEAALLAAGLAVYIIFSIKAAGAGRQDTEEDNNAPFSPVGCAAGIIGGIAGIVIGGDMVVDNASGIASALGMSETLTGLTICAMGTSLPELVTSITASKKGENDMAVGNVVGSNLFNVLGILGISGMITPIDLTAANNSSDINALIDGGLLILAGILILIFCKKSGRISRGQGIVLTVLYAAYMVYIVARN